LAACHGCRLGGLSVLGLDDAEPGGHLLRLTDVDDYLGLGFDGALTGAELGAAFAAHTRQAGTTLSKGRVDGVRIQGALKRVHSDAGTYWARAVVVATGAGRTELNAEGVARFLDRGIRDVANLNPSHYEGARAAVIGGGYEAFHAAIALARHAKFVTVLSPEDPPAADAALVQRAKTAGARVISAANVVAAQGGEGLEFLSFLEHGIIEEQSLPVEAAVVALGSAPRAPIAGLERMPQEEGYYAHGEGGKTMFGGIYVAGDCTNMEIRTLMSVTASGSLCARRLAQWLASHPLPKL
jgi:thioredoxin reductase (NADPH)